MYLGSYCRGVKPLLSQQPVDGVGDVDSVIGPKVTSE